MAKKRKEPFGRPTIYTPELANRICELTAINTCGLSKLCEQYPELPCKETINVWRWHKNDFSDQYAKAKMRQAEIMAESFEDVNDELVNFQYNDRESGATKIDGGIVAQARLLIDTRKWTASKLAPKIYGDKKEIEQLTADNERVKAELAELRAKLDEKNRSEY
jgi:hypothetical protein